MSYKSLCRSIKFFFQRTSRGFDDKETWNLDYTFAKHILPRLLRFKEINMGYPTDTPEQWNEILDQMIFTFQWYATDISERDRTTDEVYRKVEQGMQLFAEYYGALWN